MALQHSLLLLVLIAVFSKVNGVDHPNVSATAFCYDNPSCGPSTWPGICHTGKNQSPIDIDVDLTNPGPGVKFTLTEFDMNDHYIRESKHHFYGQNNGHSAQFELTRNTSALHSDMRICGGGLTACYKFAQFHFHWDEIDWDGSEHTINGARYPLELHVVHYKENYDSLADALHSEDEDAVAVMAVMFDIAEWDNLKLDSITMALQSLHFPGKVLDFHLPLSVSSFYPERKEFARYYGSLTTPTCDEKVIWTVFLTPVSISEYQMDQFRQVRNEEGVSDFNFRPIQPLNGRKVEFYRAGNFRRIQSASP